MSEGNEVSRSYEAPDGDRPLVPPWQAQPISDRIDDLGEWLSGLHPRADVGGAIRILNEIAESHAGLLAACEAALRAIDLANDDPTKRTYPLYVMLRDAVNSARGA